MGIFDKAKDAVGGDKIEQITDQILDKVEQVAAEKVDPAKAKEIRDEVDRRIGSDPAIETDRNQQA